MCLEKLDLQRLFLEDATEGLRLDEKASKEQKQAASQLLKGIADGSLPFVLLFVDLNSDGDRKVFAVPDSFDSYSMKEFLKDEWWCFPEDFESVVDESILFPSISSGITSIWKARNPNSEDETLGIGYLSLEDLAEVYPSLVAEITEIRAQAIID